VVRCWSLRDIWKIFEFFKDWEICLLNPSIAKKWQWEDEALDYWGRETIAFFGIACAATQYSKRGYAQERVAPSFGTSYGFTSSLREKSGKFSSPQPN
jgi:hypothetical protein